MSNADRESVVRWLEGYRRAWASDDPKDIGALFIEEATSLPSPFGTPWVGRDGIVEEWINRGDSKAEWRFEHSVVAVEGETAAIRGLTTYAATPDGRARSFAEFWMQKPEPKPA